MKITIDTKEDSHEEIKKIVSMLNSLVEAESAMAGDALSDDPKPIIGEGIFGMFSTNNEEEAPPAQPETPAASGGEVSGLFSENKEQNIDLPDQKVVENVKKDEDDEPRVVPY